MIQTAILAYAARLQARRGAKALFDIVNLNATASGLRPHPAGALAAQARQREALTSRCRA
jgi:hypothetical protein